MTKKQFYEEHVREAQSIVRNLYGLTACLAALRDCAEAETVKGGTAELCEMHAHIDRACAASVKLIACMPADILRAFSRYEPVKPTNVKPIADYKQSFCRKTGRIAA